MKPLALPALVLLTLLGATPSTADLLAQTSRASDLHAPFDRLLRENVRDERIDYLNVRAAWLPTLDRYLDSLAATDDTKLPRRERMAFLFNLYNATMIKAVVARHRHGWRPSDKAYGIFKEELVRLKGRRVSLNALENEIIRPTFKDPRIHVALVCGALSCPPLLPRAYRAADLDAVLDANLARFVNDSGRNPVDSASRTIRLSKIFDWYADDFGGKERLLEYVSRYHRQKLAGFKVAFTDYDWSLNIATPTSGRWVSVTSSNTSFGSAPAKSDGPRAPKGMVYAVLAEKSGALKLRRPHGQGEAWLPASAITPWSPMR